jgi:hypothetical protein
MGILLDCFTIDYMASTFHFNVKKATASSYTSKNSSFGELANYIIQFIYF